MYRIFTLLLFLAISGQAFAQGLNCTQTAHLGYTERLSDVWGYRHSSGTEYALVGVYNGVSIVSLANPAAAAQVQFIPGASTIWRDLKTWGDYMYVSSEIVNQGILIANLTTLPNTVSYQYKLLVAGGTDTVRNAHNLWVDENGYLYIAGANVHNGAPIIFNLNPDPENPVFMGVVGADYAHDIYVRGDTLWGSNVYQGYFSAYDITNKASASLLATQMTSSSFTHNAWISDDGNTLFTTDERAAAFTDAYDVSDLSNITLLDKWRPAQISEQSIIPHNVHVINDYLVTSHYVEGIVIIDAKHPDNLIEVAHYDTYHGTGSGFFGCWGAYPFLPSGLLLASDINTGLYVLSPAYKRACRLQGLITDQSTTNPIYDVQVELSSTDLIKNSDLSGTYKTGIHGAGSYDVTFRKAGYIPQTVTVQLFQDSIVTLNIALQTATPFTFNGRVVDAAAPATGLSNAKVRYVHSAGFYDADTSCNASGYFDFPAMLEEEYSILAGRWGFMTKEKLQYISASTSGFTIGLDKGIYDDATLDLGWTVSGNISTGAWERVKPNTIYQWAGMMPQNDLNSDFGTECFITGVSQSRSDSGQTVLTSPLFDATTFTDPHLGFYYWMTCMDSTYVANNDSLELWINNGSTSVKIATYQNGLYNWSAQKLYRLSDYIGLTNNMQIVFKVNNSNAFNYIEAAIDKVEVNELNILLHSENLENINNNSVTLQAYPIPFGETVTIAYEIPNFESKEKQFLTVYNLLGQTLEIIYLPSSSGQISLGNQLPNGIYLIQIGKTVKKIIKQ